MGITARIAFVCAREVAPIERARTRWLKRLECSDGCWSGEPSHQLRKRIKRLCRRNRSRQSVHDLLSDMNWLHRGWNSHLPPCLWSKACKPEREHTAANQSLELALHEQGRTHRQKLQLPLPGSNQGEVVTPTARRTHTSPGPMNARRVGLASPGTNLPLGRVPFESHDMPSEPDSKRTRDCAR